MTCYLSPAVFQPSPLCWTTQLWSQERSSGVSPSNSGSKCHWWSSEMRLNAWANLPLLCFALQEMFVTWESIWFVILYWNEADHAIHKLLFFLISLSSPSFFERNTASPPEKLRGMSWAAPANASALNVCPIFTAAADYNLSPYHEGFVSPWNPWLTGDCGWWITVAV